MIISSLLGKQDVSYTIPNATTSLLVPSTDNSFQTVLGNGKVVTLQASHKYYFAFIGHNITKLPDYMGVYDLSGTRLKGYQVFDMTNGNAISSSSASYNATLFGMLIDNDFGVTNVRIANSYVAGYNAYFNQNAIIDKAICVDITNLQEQTIKDFYDKYYPIFDLLASGGSYDTDSMPFMLSESVSVNSKDTDIIADITSGKILWEKPIMMSSLLGKQDNLIDKTVGTTTNNYFAFGNGNYCLNSNYEALNLLDIEIISGHKYYIYISFNGTVTQVGSNLYINGTSVGTVTSSFNSVNNIFSHIYEPTDNITLQRFHLYTWTSNGYVNFGIPTKTFIIDLTALGLDTLTAQQFYDNFNQYFSQLANGNEVMVKYSKYGIVDLGTLNYAYESQNTRFKVDNYEVLSNMETVSSNEAIPDIKCVGYRAVSITDFDTNNPDKTIRLHRTLNGFMYFRNTYYTDPAKFKLSLTGIYLLYKKA